MLKLKETQWDEKKLWIISGVIVFAFYLYIAICVPYTHDDWGWGITVGIDQLIHASLNSRYAGNFSVVMMTRFEWIKNMVMAVVSWTIPYVFSKISGENKREQLMFFWLYNLFVLGMPVILWSQSYGWVSGFANYTISLLCIGVFFLLCKKYFYAEQEKLSFFEVFSFLIAFVSQLFLEHVSIFLFLLSAFMVVIALRRKKQIKQFIVLFVANLSGLLIMFSSSIYKELFSTGATLTHIRGLQRNFVFSENEGLGEMVKNVFYNFVSCRMCQLWQNYSWLLFVVMFLTLAVLLKHRKTLGLRGKLLITANLLSLIGYFGLLILLYFLKDYQHKDLILGFFYLWIHVFVCLALMQIPDKQTVKKSIFFWVDAALILIPLSAIAETSSRLYLVSYFFIIATVIHIVLYLLSEEKQEDRNKIMLILCSAVVILFFMRCSIYTGILRTTTENCEKIEYAVENEENNVQLSVYEDWTYMWFVYPCTEDHLSYFKEFYGLSETVNVTFQ